MCDVAGELDDFEAALHFSQGVIEGLAVLCGQQPRNVYLPRRHQLPKGKHHVLALGERRVPPGLEGLRCHPDRTVDVAGRCQSHLGSLSAGGGVVDGPDPIRCPRGQGAIDPVVDRAHQGLSAAKALKLVDARMSEDRPRPSCPRRNQPETWNWICSHNVQMPIPSTRTARPCRRPVLSLIRRSVCLS